MNTVQSFDGINFLLHTPSWGLNNPLIIFLHGVGEKGDASTATVRRIENLGVPLLTRDGEITEKRGNFFMIAPQLQNPAGSWPALYVQKMIEWAKANLKFDHNRIYLAGLSLGGGGVWTALQDPTVAPMITAAVVCCGTDTLRSASLIVKYDIPVTLYHAVNDDKVSVTASQKAIGVLRSAKARARYFELAEGGHAIWGLVFSNIHKAYKLSNGVMTVHAPTPYEWLLSWTKAPVTPLP
jgi:predicted peptidase